MKLNKLVFVLTMTLAQLASAELNKDEFYSAYRQYTDRGATLLPLSNEKIKISKLNSQGGNVYTAYLSVQVGKSEFMDAVTFTTDAKGAIDPFNGMYSVSATMVTDSKGKDLRFPMGITEAQFAQLSQKAFEVAKEQFLTVFPKREFIGKFYVSIDSWNEVKRTVNVTVNTYALPQQKATSRSTQVSVTMSADSNKVIKSYLRGY